MVLLGEERDRNEVGGRKCNFVFSNDNFMRFSEMKNLNFMREGKKT